MPDSQIERIHTHLAGVCKECVESVTTTLIPVCMLFDICYVFSYSRRCLRAEEAFLEAVPSHSDVC